MSDLDKRWENFKKRVYDHTESGKMVLSESHWLLEESAKLQARLEEIDRTEDSYTLVWVDREPLAKERLSIINQLIEIAARMKIEQGRLQKDMKKDAEFLNELNSFNKP